MLFVSLLDFSALMIGANVVPGFVYGFVLLASEPEVPWWRRALFLLFSGFLFLLAAWIATSTRLSLEGLLYSFPAASAMGALLLYLSYILFLDHSLPKLRGSLLALAVGLIASLGPVTGFLADDHGIRSSISLTLNLLIYPLWQTLFAWMIVRLKRS